MKVKGIHTVKNSVEVEITDEEVKSIVDRQSVSVLAKALQGQLLQDFINNIEPDVEGIFTVHKGFNQTLSEQNYVLVLMDASWDYHNNVGVDKIYRVLTKEEAIKYVTIENFTKSLDKLLE